MRDVPNLECDDESGWDPEASLAGDAIDALGLDVRSVIIRELGEAGYGDHGNEDGRDLNDWLPGEANVTRPRPNPWR